jgi:hypothetical protein
MLVTGIHASVLSLVTPGSPSRQSTTDQTIFPRRHAGRGFLPDVVLVVPAAAALSLLAAGQMVKPLYLTSIMFISRGVHLGRKLGGWRVA